jgi:hypothetical protein
VADPFLGAAVSWLDRHSKAEHFLDFPNRDVWVAFPKMNFAILLASKHKLHV